MSIVPRPVLLRSELLERIGVPHAFTTRRGGLSRGVFESLNFGNPSDLPAERRDPAATIAGNLGLVLGAMGVPGRRVVQVHQVHGAECRVVRRGAGGWVDDSVRADAIATDDAGVVVGVRTADCAPVLLASADGGAVAAVHAGWRGVIGGVVPNAVRTMVELGAAPAGMAAAIGPCISAEHFEVGEEVAAEFRRAFGDGAGVVREAAGRGARPRVDLKAALRAQLLASGLRADGIEVLAQCTVRDGADFFSHRRERGVTGRMLALVGPR